MDPIDRSLILRARQRDVVAFSALVEQVWADLVRFARSVVGEADAEDVVQEGLLAAWEKLPGLRVPEAFPSWVVRIVSRRCFRRARWRRRMVPLTQALETAASSNPGCVETIHVEQILSALPLRQRAVMHLTVIEGMTDTEIGASLGISSASVRSHRRRARETILRLIPDPGSHRGERS